MRQRCKIGAWLVFLLPLHALIACAGFLAPLEPSQQDRDKPYAPPNRIHFIDESGHFHVRPFVYEMNLREGTFDQYETNVAARVPLQFFVQGSSYRWLGLVSSSLHLFGASEKRVYLLGTDGLGRDLFSRILYGGQASVIAGLLATVITLVLGALIGVAAGYFGGWTDDLLMRVAEVCLALPWLYLLFALRAFLPLSVSPLEAFSLVVVVIGTLGWARPARLVRGVVLSAKERDFVRAARGFGASHWYLLRRHVLPQTEGVFLTQAAILIPQYILAEVTLSFLGLGIPEPAPSWGNLLTSLQQYSVLVSYWWMYLPAAAMVPFFIGYLGLSSALQERRAQAKMDC